jgi:hypothetical protein
LAFLSKNSINTVYSQVIDDLFDQLKDSGENYSITGTICEQVEKIKLMEVFRSPRYSVSTSIRYIGPTKETLGEIDELVWDTYAHEYARVEEVKCWSREDLPAALKKAHEQLNRLYQFIKSSKIFLILDHFNNSNFIEHSQFSNLRINDFKTVAQEDGWEIGFNKSLGLTLDELMKLRSDLINCQMRGECRAPKSRKKSKTSKTISRSSSDSDLLAISDDCPDCS